MKILYNNHVILESTNIDALTENSLSTFYVGLKDPRLSRVGKTLSEDAQTITFDFGSAKAVEYCVIHNANFTDSVTVTISGNASDSWAAPSVTATPVKYGDAWIVPISGTYRYWQLSIDDPTNTDEYLSLGAVFLGDALTMPGMEQGQAIPRKSNSLTSKSFSGQLYGDRRLNYKSANISFPVITQTQKNNIDDFWDYCDIVQPFTMLIWEDDLDVEPPIYCALTKDVEWSRLSSDGLLWNVTLEFEEVF